MSCVVGIIQYGLSGNTLSIKNALLKAGAQVLIVATVEDLSKVDKIILPGVGSFKEAMSELESHGFIREIIQADKPVLGICLGMQLLAKVGFEYGKTAGLGIINSEVKQMEGVSLLPHVGFSKIELCADNELFKGIEGEEFYFMHSYSLANNCKVSSMVSYDRCEFVASIQEGKFFGVQFHPEKSRGAGIKLFKNFIGLPA